MQGNGDYISREAATTLFARACGECKEACEEFDGFYADCNQCLLHGVLKEFATIPAADVRPLVNTCETCGYKTEQIRVKPYDGACWYWKLHSIKNEEWCCHWKQREES